MRFRLNCDQCLKWGPQPLAGPKKNCWASKKLVTGPNGIMVAQIFCDIFLWKKRHQISIYKAKKKYMCVYCHMSKKSRVGWSALIFFSFLFLAIGKTEIVVPGSGIRFRYFIFEISGKPSFVLWRVTQFFYLLCSLFRQKASGWINKTLLLIKQQKWLSEFCVKIDRVVSKN